jgi:hypothetical protein
VSATSAISSSPVSGGAKARNLSRGLIAVTLQAPV